MFFFLNLYVATPGDVLAVNIKLTDVFVQLCVPFYRYCSK
jgi:hypothetical protein